MKHHNGPKPVPVGDRFHDKYVVNAETGCWEWQASISSTGYGRINVNQRPAYAHRVSYELHIGPIPGGLPLDHLCRNTKCVNPEHLEPVTHAENIRRGVSPSMLLSLAGRCKQGHDLSVYGHPRKGGQHCGECNRQRAKARYWQQKAAGIDPNATRKSRAKARKAA